MKIQKLMSSFAIIAFIGCFGILHAEQSQDLYGMVAAGKYPLYERHYYKKDFFSEKTKDFPTS